MDEESNEDNLPANVVRITALQARYGSKRSCQCRNPRLEVDVDAKEVLCRECKRRIDPFDALVILCDHEHQIYAETEALLEERKRLLNWRPHLLAAKAVENALRSRTMVPTCPHCMEALFPSDFQHMSATNRALAETRRQFKDAAKKSKDKKP